MKKYLLVYTLIHFTSLMFSQSYTYQPFPADTGYWFYRYYDDYHYPTSDGTNYTMSGDTIISGVNYKKISSTYLSGAIREDNKIIYFYPDTASQEYVIYNFNLQAGDFIFNTYGLFPTDTLYVDYIDTVLLTNGYHAQWHLGFTTWIDGIGSTNYLFNSTSSAPVSGHDVLEYMEGDSIVKYNYSNSPPPPPPNCLAYYSTTYDSVSNSFNLSVPTPIIGMISSYLWDFGDGTTSTLPSPSHYYPIDSLYNVCMYVVSTSGTTCSYCHVIGKDTSGSIVRDNGFFLNVNSTAIAETLPDAEVYVYPNPTNGQLNIQMTAEMNDSEIRIYTITGQLVFNQVINQESSVSLDLSRQDAGMYYVEVIKENKAYRKKLIKQ